MLRTSMLDPGIAGHEGLALPYMEVRGRSDGPHMFVMAGIHGCEYSPIEGARRFMRSLDPDELSGSVSCIPLVNVPAFKSRTPFVVPTDGKNPNRCFPGDAHGTFTDRLTHFVFENHIATADYLIDMHCGDLVESLAPFTLYDASPVEDAADAMAVAYGLDFIVRSEPSDAPIAGTSSAAAAEARIPAITPEIGGCGLLEEAAVQAHLTGARNVAKALGMLPDDRPSSSRRLRRVDRFIWLRSRSEGWWSPAVGVGAEVEQGGLLGRITDLLGEELESVSAPESGVPLFITTSPAVPADGLLLGLGAGIKDL